MGASCSTSILPEELVIKILSSLAVSDLVSCRRVNRHLNGIVDGSQQLQHHIDTAVAGVLDNPKSPLSLLERRDALARRQEAWDTCQPHHMATSEDPGINALQPALDPDGTWLHIDPLREEDYHAKMLEVAACPDDNELIAVGMRCGDVPFRSSPPPFWFEVDILRFSDGRDESPWTVESTVHLKDDLEDNPVRWNMEIEIRTDLLAVHLPGWPCNKLWVFDWKTGEEIACLKDKRISSFRLLSNSVMVVATVSPLESTTTLELFNIAVKNDNVPRTSMIKVATLELPFVEKGRPIARVHFYPLFVRNLVIRMNRLLYNMSMTKPFITKSDNMLFVYLSIRHAYGADSISFAVHPSTLLRHTAYYYSHGIVRDPVPWELWGPTVTRWFGNGIIIGGGPLTCGYRCLLRANDPASWELWDFNPYRVGCLGKGFAMDNETSRLTVETEPSWAKSHMDEITKGIRSSLPFVKLVPKKWPTYTNTSLYEDRVIGRLHLELDDRYSVDNLYFG